MQVSGRGVGWERIGESTGDLTGDLTGDSMAGLTGEMMGDSAGDLGGDEAGAAAARVGEGTEEGLWAGAGEGHTGLLATGDGVVRSSVTSSGMKGSGKKRVPGDFTRQGGDIGVICVSGWGDGLSGERTTSSSFCTGLVLDGSILEAIPRLSDFFVFLRRRFSEPWLVQTSLSFCI